MSAIGVDVGGTSTEAVLIDDQGLVQAKTSVPTETPGGPVVLDSIIDAIQGLGSEQPGVPVGIGIPGQVDSRAGTVRLAVNLGIDEPYPLAALVRDRLGSPVLLENDVRAAAFGVYDRLGAEGEDPGDLAYVSLGTGVAAGLVIDGVVHRGASGMAGEIGHVVIDREGSLCACGQTGCLETVVSGPSIAAAWRASGGEDTASALFKAAADGDETAQEVAEIVTASLAQAIHWLSAAYDVDTIVIGGGVASAGEPLLEMLGYALTKTAGTSTLANRTLDPARIRLSPNGDPHGARGAALLAARQFDLALTSESKPLGGDE